MDCFAFFAMTPLHVKHRLLQQCGDRHDLAWLYDYLLKAGFIAEGLALLPTFGLIAVILGLAIAEKIFCWPFKLGSHERYDRV